MIAYRLQEEAFGGLDRATVKLLDGLARGEKPASAVKRRLKPGTVLVREYQGERHTVTVVPDGFLWRGTTYSSLSTIARAITGTAWGGPRFFGLRGPGSRPEERWARPAKGQAPSTLATPSIASSPSGPAERGPDMNGSPKKVLRCAIYTRKSTEHNLDLEFNSLDAQREACEAYIKSQAHEGWRLIRDSYRRWRVLGGLARPPRPAVSPG